MDSVFAGTAWARWTAFRTMDDWAATVALPLTTGVTSLTLPIPTAVSSFSRVRLLGGDPGLFTDGDQGSGFRLQLLNQYGYPGATVDASLFTGCVVLPSGQRENLTFALGTDGTSVVASFQPKVVATTYQVLVRHATQGLLSVDTSAFSSSPPGIFSVGGPVVSATNASLVRW